MLEVFVMSFLVGGDAAMVAALEAFSPWERRHEPSRWFPNGPVEHLYIADNACDGRAEILGGVLAYTQYMGAEQ